mmetsp:Transcript_82349/g.209322  ORF Transcript_82349/g.209322 Transcript_82349/m.209322 type:complete len:223 (+) Transcript_82349:155-823(+)
MPAHAKDQGSCLFCVPLKIGCGLITAFHCFRALLCMAQFLRHDVRFQSGGYNPHTIHLQEGIGIFGLIFAPWGLLGIFDNKPSWIRIFNRFQYVLLFVLVLVYCSDMVALRLCDGWATSLQAQLKPNAPLYAISSKGLCALARFNYTVGFAVDFCVNLYFAQVVAMYIVKVESGPSYFIRFGSSHYGTSEHTHVKFHDEKVGEPFQHIGPTTFRPSDMGMRL